jgi:hypothetical protein
MNPDTTATATFWPTAADSATGATITAEQWVGHALPARPAPGEPRNRAERRAQQRRDRQTAKHQRREERKIEAFWRWLNGGMR